MHNLKGKKTSGDYCFLTALCGEQSLHGSALNLVLHTAGSVTQLPLPAHPWGRQTIDPQKEQSLGLSTEQTLALTVTFLVRLLCVPGC